MLLWRNAKCYEEKSYYYQIYHCLKVKLSFHEKLFQKEKNKLLLSIYSRRLSSHLWFNGRRNLSWNPCLIRPYVAWTNDFTGTYVCTTVEKISWKIKNNKTEEDYKHKCNRRLFMKKWYKVIKITIAKSTENVYHVARQNLHSVHAPYNKNKN